MELDPEFALAASGGDRRFAKVLAVGVFEGAAVALIDSNGDEREIELAEFREEVGQWTYWDSVSVDRQGVGRSSGLMLAWGKVLGDPEVQVDYNGVPHTCRSTSDGWWLFIDRYVVGANDAKVH